MQVAKLKRGNIWQILPAYTQDGVLLHREYQGPTDTHLFQAFIVELLHFCGRYPELNSVIIMITILLLIRLSPDSNRDSVSISVSIA
jgi:hypothetical protein